MLYFMDLIRKILHSVVILVLSVLWTIMGMVAHVQLLVHYASCCMCDSDESVLKMLSTNAAQPIEGVHFTSHG